LASLGHLSKFQWVSRLGFVTAPTSLNRSQPNFARCIPSAGLVTIYTFLAALAPKGTLTGVKFTLCPSLALFNIGSVTARHSSSGRQPNCGAEQGKLLRTARRFFSTSIFGGAAITWHFRTTSSSSSFVMAALCNRGGGIIFLPCDFYLSSSFFFFMVALCNRADHNIFIL